MRIEWNLHPNYGGPGRVYLPSGIAGIRSDVLTFPADHYPVGSQLTVQHDDLSQNVYEVREAAKEVTPTEVTETGTSLVREWVNLDIDVQVPSLDFSAHVADAPVRVVLNATTE